MSRTTNGEKSGNLTLVAFLVFTIIFTAFYEGYLSSISPLFGAVLLVGVGMCIWLALSTTTSRLLTLIIGIFLIEYVKESIGIRSKLWSYRGANGCFNFGVWAWVLGGVSVYTLTTKIVIRQLARIRFAPPRWLNPVVVVLISSLVFLTLGDYWSGVRVLFLVFYSALIVAAFYVSTKTDFRTFTGLVVTSWVVGNIGEYAGSVDSACWVFTHNPNYPPAFLVFGCWPLEIITQYAFVAWVAGEPLNVGIASAGREVT